MDSRVLILSRGLWLDLIHSVFPGFVKQLLDIFLFQFISGEVWLWALGGLLVDLHVMDFIFSPLQLQLEALVLSGQSVDDRKIFNLSSSEPFKLWLELKLLVDEKVCLVPFLTKLFVASVEFCTSAFKLCNMFLKL